MKMKVTHRRIESYWTTNPGEIDRLMLEAEKLHLPEPLYKTAWDIAKSVKSNNGSKDEYCNPELIASYILRYALYLQKRGELVEAPPPPPKKKRQPKPGQEPEGGAK